jgi:hypothetical protein
LPILALDRNKAHVGTLYRFPDPRCIGPVGLDEGAHEPSGNQADFVTRLAQLPRPVVGTPAGLHGNETRLSIGEELRQSLAPDLPAVNLARLPVHPM